MRSLEDVQACLEAGADMIGLVMVPGSKRQLLEHQALILRERIAADAQVVGVFMDQPWHEVRRLSEVLALDHIQLHGSEHGQQWEQLGRCTIRRIQPACYRIGCQSPTVIPLVDAGAGDGVAFDWPAWATYPDALIAGGLTMEGVGALIKRLRPRGVDVSSGVEEPPGIKSARLIHGFCRNARAAFQQL
ncbi:phosphoribosylanthranilate isomerase [Pseudomonas sp. B329]|uniref:phosphoribosylanthranilate isomerase n=1 Tax=Pseudomonas sp. B329 TaxID=1553459 RepID=UPI002004D5A0